MYIELGGKERWVRFDYNAICDMESRSGLGIMKLMDENAGFNTLRLLLWAGIKHENKALTPEMVGAWVQEYVNNGGKIEKLFEDAAMELGNSGILGKQQAEGNS